MCLCVPFCVRPTSLCMVGFKIHLAQMIIKTRQCVARKNHVIFQSYQDDVRMIMKGCMQWNPIYVEKISPRARLEPGTTGSVGQHLTH